MSMQTTYAEITPSIEEVAGLAGPVVLEFGANWCAHCQAAQPYLAEVLTGYPGLQHLKLEDGPGRPLGRHFKVKLWPTLVFLRDGQEVERLVRPLDSESIRRAMQAIQG